MLCLKKRRTYSFTQGTCNDIPRRSSKEKNGYNETLNMAVTTLPRKHRSREERSSGGMVLTVTEDTPADMLAGSMELLVQLPRDHNVHTQRVTVPRSTPMMDLLVQIATAHKLSASSYTLQAIGERGLVLPHQPNTPIGALDALQVKLLPKQGTFLPRKTKQANQPFETTFRLQVLLPRNQLYVSRVSPKMNLGKILEDVCNEKNLDKNKYELRHPANVEETLDLSLSLQDYHLQEVMLYAKQGRQLGAALSSQDIMALQRQEERRRQQAKQSVFGFMFRKSKESSLSIDSLGGRSVSPARSDETGRSVSPLAPPSRPLRKRRPAPKPPVRNSISGENDDETKDKLVISHSRNSSDSSGYHEASVLSDNPDSGARMPETLPRRSKPPCKLETSRKLEQTSQASKSLGNLAIASGGLSHGISSTSISSTATNSSIRKKRAAPPPPIARPLSSAISTQALERIVDSEESLTSDIDISKSPSDIAASSKANSDIGVNSKANSDIGVHSMGSKPSSEIGYKIDAEFRAALADHEDNDLLDIERSSMKIPPPARFKQSSDDKTNDEQTEMTLRSSFEKTENVDIARLVKRDNEALAPTPKPRIAIRACETLLPVAPRRKNLESTLLDATTYLLPHAVESSIVNDDEINASKPRFEANQDEALFSDDGEKKFAGRSNSQDTKLEIANMLTSNIEEITRKKRPSSNVESMNIYDETKFSQEEISKDDNSSTEVSCAIISTIPKCAHLTPNTEDKVEEKNQGNSTPDKQTFELVTTSKNENLPMPKCPKVFRSQSVVNDFEINPLEKHIRHLTSHPEDITCALNPNFSLNVLSLETRDDVDETRFINDEDSKHDNGVEIFPQFVTQNTNLGCQEDFKLLVNDDCWEPQLIEQSGSGDRTMETDILLQKVSDTLSNSLPIAKTTDHKITGETKAQDKMLESITNDESDGIHESFDIFVKANNVKSTKHNDTNRESLSGKVNLGNSPNATMNSQQDTSDYVSAVGDDLSITDWEYQLPAPPSAFRDNITPEFDGYDTITLRSVEAFKEPVVVPSDDEKSAMVDSSLRESPIPPPSIFNEDSETSKFSIMPEEIVESREKPEKPKPSPQTFELKKEIISELSTKIENGTLPRTSGKNFEDTRRTTVELSAPKIAPVDNTLSNFTITTYSRQKSLNIFEEEATEEKRNFPRAKKSEEKINTFVSSATSKRTNESDKENFGSRGSLERIVDNFQSDKRAVLSRAQSVENIIEPEVEFKRSETHSTQHDSLLRRTMSSNGQEKSTNVHRSKSYITLANNSKYRGDVDGEKNNGSFRNDNVVSGMMKSTSVTNLNHELPRSNEKFSQWRENILKRQEEPSKEKQLQSLQVLKNILPRLKTPQQTEENIVDSSNEKTHFDHGRSNTLSEGESMESKSIASESKPQKRTEDATTKRYKYTGPPAINLGSWSERPRANVQLKKDTDYKFGANDNNITGAKTVINLNGTRNERNDDKRELTLSRSVSKNESTTHRETPQDRRDSEEDVAKTMMTQKTITGFKKSASNRMMIGEPKSISRIENKPIVTSVALKKTQIEKPDIDYETVEKSFEDDDVKIDTKPVNFKELTKTFGQEVCLRPKPKRTLQNRHSDYYGMRPEMAQNFTNTNGQTSFWDNANPNVTKFGDSIKNLSNGIQRDATIKRCTSIVRIESHNNNNNRGLENCDTTKNHTTSTKINGPMPVVKGFKIRTSENPMKIPNVQQENDAGTNSSRKTSKVPIPPTMPIITGVTLKNSTTRPKSLQISNADPHDQLLESIRNFGGRDRLRSVNISS